MNVNEIMHARVPLKVCQEFPHVDPDLVESLEMEDMLHHLRRPYTIIFRTDAGEVSASGHASIDEARKELEKTYTQSLKEGWEPETLIDNVLKKTYNIAAKAVVSFVEVDPGVCQGCGMVPHQCLCSHEED